MKLALNILWLALLIAPIRVMAQPQVAIDINQPDHLLLRFERIPLVISDPPSAVNLPLDIQLPGLGVAWQGLDFSVVSPANTGYRAAALSAGGATVGAESFLRADAASNPLARLPISDEPVLAQVWASRSGTIPADGAGSPQIDYVWNVSFSGGAGFGLFGTLEATVVPEPGIRSLAVLGLGVLVLGRRRRE